MEPRRMITY